MPGQVKLNIQQNFQGGNDGKLCTLNKYEINSSDLI